MIQFKRLHLKVCQKQIVNFGCTKCISGYFLPILECHHSYGVLYKSLKHKKTIAQPISIFESNVNRYENIPM